MPPEDVHAILIERHAQLPFRQRQRIEKLLSREERAQLRRLMHQPAIRHDTGSRISATSYLARFSPGIAGILAELVDEKFKVKKGILAPDAELSIQRWADDVASNESIDVRASHQLGGLMDWLLNLWGRLGSGLGRMNSGQVK